jgi:aryl-alcohol dehydrogenase-like predicted oxidoreductase
MDGAIVGFRRPKQVEELIDAAGLELSAADMAEIEKAL